MTNERRWGGRLGRGVLIGLAALQAASSTQLAGATASPAPLYHLVRPGDTLSEIGQRHRVTVAELVALNNRADPDFIRIGERLRLPDTVAAGGDVPPGRSVDASVTPPASGGAGSQKPSGPAAGKTPAPAETASTDATAMLDAAAARHQVDPALVRALARQRSGGRTDVTGPRGARGPLQVTGATVDWVGRFVVRRPLNADDPADQIEAGVAYLAYLLRAAGGDERQALAAYLQGPRSARERGVSATTERAIGEIVALKAKSSGAPAAPSIGTVESETSLAERVAARVRAVGGPGVRVGVAARNLSTGERLEIRADETFHGASVLKLPILVAYYRAAAEPGQETPPKDRALLEKMIRVSDNRAANLLVGLLSPQRVNGEMAELELRATALVNPFSDSGPVPTERFNRTTPRDMLQLMQQIVAGQAADAAATREMRALLEATRDDSKLKRPLPASVRVLHKSGWFDGVSNDVGIVYAPRATYAIAVFAEGPFDGERGNQIVGAVSSVVYDAWGR